MIPAHFFGVFAAVSVMWLCIPVFPAGGQITNYKILHVFDRNSAPPIFCALAQDSTGTDPSLYGASPNSGSASLGSVFKLNPDGSGYSVLRNFTTPNDGIAVHGVTLGSDGWLYGTTQNGGSNDSGLIFKMRKNGSDYEVLRRFARGPPDFDPAFVQASLIEASNGVLYGVSIGGGTADEGTIFRINRDGTGFAVIHNFNRQFSGDRPGAALTEGPDGMLYGTASTGGARGGGTIFKITTAGDDGSLMYHFGRSPDADGPSSPLLPGSDGRFYGLTSRGGSNNLGTVYWVDNQKNYGVILHFTGGTMGARPAGGLVEGPDGKLYGTAGFLFNTTNTLFRLKKDGSDFEVMHTFFPSDGTPTQAGLMRTADGALYGVIQRSDSLSRGDVFRFGHNVGISANAGSLEVIGIPGQSYLLQRSTDLRTWSTLTNIVLNTPSSSYQDPAPPSPAAFYRVRTP